MMKKLITDLSPHRLWLAALLIFNILYGFLLWLIGGEKLFWLIPVMLLGSAGIYAGAAFAAHRRAARKRQAFVEFLEQPEPTRERALLALSGANERPVIQMIGQLLRENSERILKDQSELEEYEDYIEAWAHEIKTPLALMTLVLDNRRDELSPMVYRRLEFARTKMQEDVERMLYYGRIKSANTDYFFEPVSLGQVCREMIDEYDILLQEQQIRVDNQVPDVQVIADRKGLAFCIRQVLSNAAKYMKPETEGRRIWLTAHFNVAGEVVLAIRDNGVGVQSYDLPFIFDKGFTGDRGIAGKGATGMGLYLARQVAGHMNIRIGIAEEWQDGFEIRFVFPKVDEKKTNCI